MSDPRIDSLIDEAHAPAALPAQHHAPRRRARTFHGGGLGRPLRHRPRQRRAAGCRLSSRSGQLNTLQATLLRPGGSGVLHPDAAQEWGSQNGVTVTTRLHRLARSAAAHRGGGGRRLRRRRHRDVGHLAVSLLREHGAGGRAGAGGQRRVRRILRLGDQHRVGRWHVVQHPPRLLQLGVRLPHQPVRGSGHRGPQEQLPRDLRRVSLPSARR